MEQDIFLLLNKILILAPIKQIKNAPNTNPKLNWQQLKTALCKLSLSDSQIKIERLGVILDEQAFLKTHIAVVDKYPQISPRTDANNRARLLIAKPHFDRLLAYYLVKTQL